MYGKYLTYGNPMVCLGQTQVVGVYSLCRWSKTCFMHSSNFSMFSIPTHVQSQFAWSERPCKRTLHSSWQLSLRFEQTHLALLDSSSTTICSEHGPMECMSYRAAPSLSLNLKLETQTFWLERTLLIPIKAQQPSRFEGEGSLGQVSLTFPFLSCLLSTWQWLSSRVYKWAWMFCISSSQASESLQNGVAEVRLDSIDIIVISIMSPFILQRSRK